MATWFSIHYLRSQKYAHCLCTAHENKGWHFIAVTGFYRLPSTGQCIETGPYQAVQWLLPVGNSKLRLQTVCSRLWTCTQNNIAATKLPRSTLLMLLTHRGRSHAQQRPSHRPPQWRTADRNVNGRQLEFSVIEPILSLIFAPVSYFATPEL